MRSWIYALIVLLADGLVTEGFAEPPSTAPSATKQIRPLLLLDAAGDVIGRVAGVGELAGMVYYLTPEGYLSRANRKGEMILRYQAYTAYFESADCSGQHYFSYLPRYLGTVYAYQTGDGGEALRYVPPDEEPVELTFYSQGDSSVGACQPIVLGETLLAIRDYPNNPAVTGVPNDPYLQPLHFR